MGRNKKGHKHRKVKKQPRINIKQYIIPLIICVIFYSLLIFVCGLMRLGSKWELWKDNADYLPLILTISLYRVLEYSLPAILIRLFNKSSWLTCFNQQFACYAFMNALVFLGGLDYAWDIELFSSAESFIIIIGYLISCSTKRNISVNNTVELVDNANEE